MENDDDLLHAIELVNEDKEQIMEQNATIVSQGGGGQAREWEGCLCLQEQPSPPQWYNGPRWVYV